MIDDDAIAEKRRVQRRKRVGLRQRQLAEIWFDERGMRRQRGFQTDDLHALRQRCRDATGCGANRPLTQTACAIGRAQRRCVLPRPALAMPSGASANVRSAIGATLVKRHCSIFVVGKPRRSNCAIALSRACSDPARLRRPLFERPAVFGGVVRELRAGWLFLFDDLSHCFSIYPQAGPMPCATSIAARLRSSRSLFLRGAAPGLCRPSARCARPAARARSRARCSSAGADSG